jgi:bifunctional ADP-heptose synthase (sugar kinase/adenylyltransferase)
MKNMEEKRLVYEGNRMSNSIKEYEYISHTDHMFIVREHWGRIVKRVASTNHQLLSLDKEKVREFLLDGITEALKRKEDQLRHLRQELERVENL